MHPLQMMGPSFVEFASAFKVGVAEGVFRDPNVADDDDGTEVLEEEGNGCKQCRHSSSIEPFKSMYAAAVS
jgi:hypothetical protein